MLLGAHKDLEIIFRNRSLPESMPHHQCWASYSGYITYILILLFNYYSFKK